MGFGESAKTSAKQRYYAFRIGFQRQDMEALVRQALYKIERFKSHIPGSLVDFWDDIRALISMAVCYSTGSYREVPWRSMAAICGALLYFIAPLDALPDFIPVSGYLDDAFIFKLVIDLVGKDIEDFKRWRDGGLTIENRAATGV